MSFFKKRTRELTPAELSDIQELHRIAFTERFKADHFEKNKAVLNVEGARGKALAAQQKLVANLMESLKNQHVSAKLAELGYKPNDKVIIDLNTGIITRQ